MLRRDYFRCTNFHGLGQIFASLTRENIAEREAAVHNQGRRMKKTLPLPSVAYEHGSPRNRCSASTQSQMRKEGRSMTKTCQAYWGGIFEARTDDERPYAYETILDYDYRQARL